MLLLNYINFSAFSFRKIVLRPTSAVFNLPVSNTDRMIEAEPTMLREKGRVYHKDSVIVHQIILGCNT